MVYSEAQPEQWERARAVFAQLTTCVAAQQYDDDYLRLLIELQKLLPTTADGHIFYALYALAHRAVPVALAEAKAAYAERRVNPLLWRVLQKCYAAQGDGVHALCFAGMNCALYEAPVEVPLPRAELARALEVLSLSLHDKGMAPVTDAYLTMTEQGLQRSWGAYVGEFVPSYREPHEGWRLWAGAYNEVECNNGKGVLWQTIKQVEPVLMSDGGDLMAELIPARRVTQPVAIKVPLQKTYVVPVAGELPSQPVYFTEAGGVRQRVDLGQLCYQFFRLTHDTRIESGQPFMLGRPVVLGHAPQRRKVVLNIFLDALSWQAVRERHYELVPNMMRFFAQGVIFDQMYATSEFTYPAYPSIATGRYPQHTQLFNEHLTVPLAAEVPTLVEQLKAQGYYCTRVAGDGSDVYVDLARGFDRLLVNRGDLPIYKAVERAIQQMQAFGECDQYISLYALDCHPWDPRTLQLPLAVQVQTPLAEFIQGEQEAADSAHMTRTALQLRWNEQGIRDTDRVLGELFQYLEAHYSPDEYLVSVFSDHGTSIYDEKYYMLSGYHTNAAFMLRGAGVPALGHVDELVSAVDIYPALGHLLGLPVPEDIDGNLPAALGGQARTYVASTSIYPGQTYKLCLRTATQECRLEARHFTDEDGRCDLRGAGIEVYDRQTGQQLPEQSAEQFLPWIREFTRLIDSHGLQWPEMRTKRAAWYAPDAGK